MKLRILHIPLFCLGIAVAAQAGAADPTLSELFLEVDSAVVEIATIQQVVADQGPARRVSAGSLGSGFLISADGQIMTAAHVVQVADQLVALIKVETVPAGITPATLGDSDSAKIGDEVFVIGAPYGIAHSLTAGHISGRRTPDQLFGGFEKVELLQTDAAINEGNSGGPMFNMRGEAIGIVSHILSSSGGFQGIGFVITSNIAKHLLLDDPTPWTGLKGVVVEGPLARALNIPQKAGMLVESVAASSPASALGLQPGKLKAQIAGQSLTLGGDIILAVNGILIGSPDFSRRIGDSVRALTGDDRLALRVLRDGDMIELSKPASVLGFDR